MAPYHQSQVPFQAYSMQQVPTTIPYQTYNMQIMPAQPRVAIWGQLKNGEADLCGIIINQRKQPKTADKNLSINSAASACFLSDNSGNILGLGNNTVITDEHPPGQTQVNIICLNSIKFHSCEDVSNKVDITLDFSNSATKSIVSINRTLQLSFLH